MKRYTVKVLCKGCRHEITLGFMAPKTWSERAFQAECTRCESLIQIEIKQSMMKKNILTRVQMVKHSEKLLRLLKNRSRIKKVKDFLGKVVGCA